MVDDVGVVLGRHLKPILLVVRRSHRLPAYRAPLPSALAADVRTADFASAYGVDVVAEERSAEAWARTMFEQAPRWLRWLVLLGWRRVLQLRLGPLTSSQHVLGWAIVHAERERLELMVDSPLLTARKVVIVTSGRVTVATLIKCRKRYAKPIWTAVSAIHCRTEPLLLTKAANNQSQ